MTGQSTVTVGAFGKHPSAPDHLQGIGLDTPLMREFKQSFYDDGITRQIATWQKLDAAGQSVPWGHLYLFRSPDGRDVVVARLWPSTDAVGRPDFPMVLCAHVSGRALDGLLEVVVPQLIQSEAELKSVATFDQVREVLDRLRKNLAFLSSQRLASDPSLLARGVDGVSTCLERADGDGLLRVTASIADFVMPAAQTTGSSRYLRRDLHLRVPSCAADEIDTVRTWAGFTIAITGDAAPIRLIRPDGATWVDLILGEPSEARYYCFRAGIEVVNLATQSDEPLDAEPRRQAVAALEAARKRAAKYQIAGPAEAPQPSGTDEDPASQDGSSSLTASTTPRAQFAAGLDKDRASAPPNRRKARIVAMLLAGLAIFLTLSVLGVAVWRNSSPVPDQTVDPAPAWADQANLRLQTLKRIRGSLSQALAQTKLAFADATPQMSSEVNQYTDLLKVADNESNAVQPWSAPVASDVAEERRKADSALSKVEERARQLPRLFIKTILDHERQDTSVARPPLRDAWIDYVGSLQRASEQSSPASRPEAAPEISSQVSGLLEELSATRKGLLELETLSTLDPALDWPRDTPQPVWKTDLRTIRTAVLASAGSEKKHQRETQLAQLRLAPGQSARQLAAARKQFIDSANRLAADCETSWRYWCEVADLLSDPCAQDVGSRLANLKTRSTPREASAGWNAGEAAAGTLQKTAVRIAQVTSLTPAELVSCIRDTQAAPIVTIAAWRQLCERARATPGQWPAEDLTRDIAVFARVNSALSSSPNTNAANCGALRGEIDLVSRERWTRYARARPHPEEVIAAARDFRVDLDATLKTLKDSSDDARLRYNLLAYQYNSALAGGDATAGVQLRKQFIEQARLALAGIVGQPRDADAKKFVDSHAEKTTRLAPLTELGPGAHGFTGASGANGRLTFTDPADADVKLEFSLVTPRDPAKGRPFYLCTTELTVGALRSATSADPEIAAALRKAHLPDELIRGWIFSGEDAVSPIALRRDWVKNVPLPAERITWHSPATYLSPQLAVQIAGALGCRLPTVVQWKEAYQQFAADDYSNWKTGKPVGEKPNLRDKAWLAYMSRNDAQNFFGRSLELQLGATGTFLPAGTQLAPVQGTEPDGFVWFREPAVADGKFHDLVGNVAEWAVSQDNGPKSLPDCIMGLSALCGTADKVNGVALTPDAPDSPPEKKAFSDVGIRLSFDAPPSPADSAHALLDPLAKAPYIGPG